MKLIATFILSVTCLIGFAQNYSTTTFYDELSRANSTTDSLISLYTLKAYANYRPELLDQLIEEGSFFSRRPHWLQTEKLAQKKDTTSNQVFTQFLATAGESAFNTYANLLALSNNYETQPFVIETKEKNNDSTSEKLLANLNKITLLQIQEKDVELDSIRRVTLDLLGDKKYEQLLLVSIYDFLAPIYGSEYDSSHVELLAIAISLSEKKREFQIRAMLYALQFEYYFLNNEIENGIKASYKRIEMCEMSTDTAQLVDAYVQLSMYFFDQKDESGGKEVLNKARVLAEVVGDQKLINDVKYGDIMYYHSLEKYPEMCRILKDIYTYSDDDENINWTAFILQDLVYAYSMREMSDSSYYYFLELQKVDPQNEQQWQEQTVLFVLPHLRATGQIEKALQYLEDIEDYVKEMNADEGTQDYLVEKVKVLQLLGRYDEALSIQDSIIALNTVLLNEKYETDIVKAQLGFEYDKEKELTAAQNATEVLRIRGQRTIALIMGVFGLLLALIGIGIAVYIRKKGKIISEQNDELTELNSIKDTIFKIIGHDLRKPSLSFRNLSENINYLIEKEDFSRLIRLSKEIEGDALQFYNLTDNLLNWAAGQKDDRIFKHEIINIYDLVQETIQHTTSSAASKNIKIKTKISHDGSINLDKNSFQTIIRNLLDNAIKYSVVGKSISISGTIENQRLRMTIEDQGTGMDSKTLQKIVNQEGIESTPGTKDEMGLGIGLRVVHSLINQMNGTLDVKSTPGNGSVFILEIPGAKVMAV